MALAVLALAVWPVAAAADHRPGHGGGGAGNLTLAAQPATVTFGRAVTLSGRLAGNNNSGRQVTVRSDPFPFDSFDNAGTATTNAQGDYALTQTPSVNTRYQARSGNEESAIVTVLVRPALSLRLSDSTPRRGQRVRFSGRVCPEHDGSRVAIQRRTRAGFRTVARTTLRDLPGTTCSRYARRLRVFRDGTYRAVIRGHGDHATGISPRRRANVP
ncbi:MAG TPA: hypothetical protein VHG69_06580 [Thermoleophilaceae bacterium]|nr:hypothetical protein [Thermoleophilaceae bacterium]